MKARDVCLEESAQVPRVQGVVCSMKDNFGFIKQLEGTVDLFFHFSEYMGQLSQLSIGEAVEFEVHTRNVRVYCCFKFFYLRRFYCLKRVFLCFFASYFCRIV